MGVSEMRFEVYEAAAFDLLRDQVELLQARVKDDEERMLDRLDDLSRRMDVQERIVGQAWAGPGVSLKSGWTGVPTPRYEAMRAVAEAAVAYRDSALIDDDNILNGGAGKPAKDFVRAVRDYRKQAGA